jgi:hypothetical protein
VNITTTTTTTVGSTRAPVTDPGLRVQVAAVLPATTTGSTAGDAVVTAKHRSSGWQRSRFPTDPTTYRHAALMLLLVAVAATWVLRGWVHHRRRRALTASIDQVLGSIINTP